ncbi:MAG: 30S ribosome-binding factor RbfA [Chloroflexota bacterium]
MPGTHPHRRERVAVAILRRLSDLIQTEVKDPRVGFVTVTEVTVSPDTRVARVHVSIMGTPEEQKETLKTLKHAAGFLRRELGRSLTTRNTPELWFELDTSLESGDRVLRLLNEVKE